MNDLDENSIRFCLLHEEGHIRMFYLEVAIFLTVMFGLLTIFLILGLVFLFIAIIALLIPFRWLLLCGEYHSDTFAADTLKKNYDEFPKPSKIVEIALKKVPHGKFSYISHPSDQKRVKSIMEYVDNK